MKTAKSILNDVKNTLEIKGLIEVYEELAASKMQKVRHAILSTRQFYEGLEKLSDEVGNDFEQVSQEGQGGKTIAVFIGSNSGLYGSIIDATFKLFFEYISKNKSEVYIVGKTGEELMKTLAPKVRYDPLEFPDDVVDQSSVDRILLKLFPYKKIKVFYGKFLNIAIQHPAMASVSGDILPKTEEEFETLQKKHFEYFYEPSFLAVSNIFANEILSSLMEQILRESQLAKFASRLIYLDQAIDNVDSSLTVLENIRRRFQKRTSDKKQNAMVSRVIAREI